MLQQIISSYVHLYTNLNPLHLLTSTMSATVLATSLLRIDGPSWPGPHVHGALTTLSSHCVYTAHPVTSDLLL